MKKICMCKIWMLQFINNNYNPYINRFCLWMTCNNIKPAFFIQRNVQDRLISRLVPFKLHKCFAQWPMQCDLRDPVVAHSPQIFSSSRLKAQDSSVMNHILTARMTPPTNISILLLVTTDSITVNSPIQAGYGMFSGHYLFDWTVEITDTM